MTDLTTSLDKGEAALSALYALQMTAMKEGDLVTQKALKDDIDDLTYQLTQLSAAEVEVDEVRIAALNTGLDAATQAAEAGLKNIGQLVSVLQTTVAAAKLVSGVVQLAAALG